MNADLEKSIEKLMFDEYLHERIVSKHELAVNMFYLITANDYDDVFKKFYKVEKGFPYLIKSFHMSERDGEQVVYCQNCAWFDGEFCRHLNNVKKHSDGTFKVWDVRKSEEDFCSDGEQGDYEPWGFED